MRVAAPSVWWSVAPLRQTPGSKSSLCAYPCVLPCLWRINVSEVHAFLGTIGVCHMFILNFAKHANPLVHLTCKGVLFHFREEQRAAQEDLKKVLLASPAL